MAKPLRNAASNSVLSPERTFFVTTKTSMGRRLLQSERNAMLFIGVLRAYMAAGKFKVHDFVVMPDHVHLLLTVGKEMSGRTSHAVRQGRLLLSPEEGVPDIQARCGSAAIAEVRVEGGQRQLRKGPGIYCRIIRSRQAWLRFARRVFPYCFTYLAKQKAAGAKARSLSDRVRPRLKSGPDTKRIRSELFTPGRPGACPELVEGSRGVRDPGKDKPSRWGSCQIEKLQILYTLFGIGVVPDIGARCKELLSGRCDRATCELGKRLLESPGLERHETWATRQFPTFLESCPVRRFFLLSAFGASHNVIPVASCEVRHVTAQSG